jgi:hypothetical protein
MTSQFCRLDGTSPMIPVVRGLVVEEAAITGAGAVSIDYTVLWEMQMEQWTLHTSAIPTTSLNGEATLTYQHRTDPRQNTLLRSVNLADEGVQDLVCISPFRWKAGDHVIVAYANPDNLNVGTQFLGIEIIP